MIADKMNGLVNFQSGFSLAHRQFIVDFAARHRLTVGPLDAGGLMAWSPDQDEQFREAARYADKVLPRCGRSGTCQSNTPPDNLLTINLAAAKALEPL